MRFAERRKTRGVKSNELLTRPEAIPAFRLEEFFTPEEWENIGKTLVDSIEATEDTSLWLSSFLVSALALSILDPEKLQQIRSDKKFAQRFGAEYQEVVDSKGVNDEQVFIANWLFPKIEQKMAKTVRESYQDDLKHGDSVSYFSSLVLVDPNVTKEVQVNERLLIEKMRIFGTDTIELLKIALFKSHLPNADDLIQTAKRVRHELLLKRDSSGKEVSIKDISERLVGAAFARAAFAESVEIRDGAFVLHDRGETLGTEGILPERLQV